LGHPLFLIWQGDNFSVFTGFRHEKQKILKINFLQKERKK